LAQAIEAEVAMFLARYADQQDFSEALEALLGPEAPGLSPATISRLQHSWHEALTQGQGRSLRGKRYVYFWGDGVYGSVPDLDVSGCKRL
jgi:putative transposase